MQRQPLETGLPRFSGAPRKFPEPGRRRRARGPELPGAHKSRCLDAPLLSSRAVVTYQISFPAPGAHLVQVRLAFAAPAAGDGCTVWMAAWTPGSYLVREYARNLRTITATVDGQPVTPVKLSKDTWRIPVLPGQRVCIDYSVHAHELSVRTAHHDPTHAFLHPAQIFLIPAEIAGPFTVEIALPSDWQAVSLCADPGSERRSPGRFTLELPDLDTLLDTPIECGVLQLAELAEPAAHFRVAVWGEPLPAVVLRRLPAVLAQVEATWPTRPYERYTFIVHAAVGAAGGLEHLFGSVLGVDPERFAAATRHDGATADPGEADDGVLDFLELAAHELFHAWNGKRLRPAALGPFDYRGENYTRELWLVEGLTSYYDRLCVLRSGEMPVATFLRRLAADLGRLAQIPGRHVQSIAEASFDAWIKLYRPQDDYPNASISYYLKGSLVGLLIDLWLRARRPEGHGLDAVLADLWCAGGDSFATQKIYQSPGYTVDEFIECLTRHAGEAPPAWLRAAWDRPGELDLSGLAHVGLDLSQQPGPHNALELGFSFQDRGGSPWVQYVLSGSPAEAAGLAAGDELLAARPAGGAWLRLRTARTPRVWDHLRPGEPAELMVSRRERLESIHLRFEAARGAQEIKRLEAPSTEIQENFRRWTRRSWNDT